jgi:signal peptidase I
VHPRWSSHFITVSAQKRSSGSQKKNVVADVRAKRTPRRARRASGSRTWDNVKSLLGALAIFLVIRAFLVEAYRIPSESMVPTLLVGDWLFVNKLVYGPHIPFTNTSLPGYREPTRGDVAVFTSPTQYDNGADSTPTLVKRIVGQPGDTLYMRSDVFYVNGQREQRPGIITGEGAGGSDVPSELFAWMTKYSVTGTRFGPPTERPTLGTWGPLVVPPGYFFMMGDNRHASKDTRFWGMVPRANFRGRPLFVYYSYNAIDSDRALPFLTDIRWSRLGHWIK